MLDKFGLFLGLIFLLGGAFLLHIAISGSGPNQTVQMLVGAALVPLGSATIFLLVKDWWYWRHWKRQWKGEHGECRD
jgi:hypothetical protein